MINELTEKFAKEHRVERIDAPYRAEFGVDQGAEEHSGAAGAERELEEVILG